MGLNVKSQPTMLDVESCIRRCKLIKEELEELVQACAEGDLVGVADALGDLEYVVKGSAVEFGIDLEPIFDEVHRSNMTKKGGYKNEYGKWIKPATYEPAVLEPILLAQGWNPDEDSLQKETGELVNVGEEIIASASI